MSEARAIISSDNLAGDFQEENRMPIPYEEE